MHFRFLSYLPIHLRGGGIDSATTPALNRQLWGNALEAEQRLSEKDTEIGSLMPQNDEKGDVIHSKVAQLEPQVAESGDADGLSRKRPRDS